MTQQNKQQYCIGEPEDEVGGCLQPWQMTILRWLGMFVFALCLMLSPNLRAKESQQRFYTLVAAMITKVSDYTNWPVPIDKDHPGIVKLAVLTEDQEVFDFFEEAIENRRIGNITWKVDQINSLNEAANYRFLYVGSGSVVLSKDWHQQFKEKGILTFGESDIGNCIFTFAIAGSRLQFELDLIAAKQAGVGFDPRLIKLASKRKRASLNP